jgi:3-oxoacyl-[acyl-carrier protein] reductase
VSGAAGAPARRFEGQGLLVTGGTRGIGRAVVLGAVAEGARVVFCGRDAAAGRQVEEAAGGAATLVLADVTVEADVERLYDEAGERLPRIDAVVNNAGVAHGALLVDTSLADWQRVLAVNLRGPFLSCRRAVEEMLGQGGGRIVNVSSFAAHGLVGEAAYAAAKAGLISMTRSIAKEVGRARIAVNAVVPGFIDTEMLAGLSEPARRARAHLGPERRLGTAEEVARAILFLASADAAFVTGDVLYVSGGVREVPRLEGA